MSVSSVGISFIVPVRNDAANLRRCLASIGHSAARVAHEIIVVDNGSSDESAAVARAAGARVLQIREGAVASLRNRAAGVAAGSVLAFVDADHEIGPDWAGTALEVLSRHDIGIVGTFCLPPHDPTWVQRVTALMRPLRTDPFDTEWLGSGNMAIRRADFEALGGFDASFESCEDVDLCQRLRSRGLRIVNEPRLRSVHYGEPATLRALFLGELWRSRDNVRASLRSLSWRGLPSLAIPPLGLAALVVGTGGLLVGTPGSVSAAGVGFGCLLGMSALRTAWMLAGRQGDFHHGRRAPRAVAEVFAVASVYDLARALAPVSRVTHRRRRRLERGT